MKLRPPKSTRSDTLVPSTTLFRSYFSREGWLDLSDPRRLRPNASRLCHRRDILFVDCIFRPPFLGQSGSSFSGSVDMPGMPTPQPCISTISIPQSKSSPFTIGDMRRAVDAQALPPMSPYRHLSLTDRKSVGEGRSVYDRLDLGGCRSQ